MKFVLVISSSFLGGRDSQAPPVICSFMDLFFNLINAFHLKLYFILCYYKYCSIVQSSSADVRFSSLWLPELVATHLFSSKIVLLFPLPLSLFFWGFMPIYFLIMELSIFKYRQNNMTDHYVPSSNFNNYQLMASLFHPYPVHSPTFHIILK